MIAYLTERVRSKRQQTSLHRLRDRFRGDRRHGLHGRPSCLALLDFLDLAWVHGCLVGHAHDDREAFVHVRRDLPDGERVEALEGEAMTQQITNWNVLKTRVSETMSAEAEAQEALRVPFIFIVLLMLSLLALGKRVQELRIENDDLRRRLLSYRLTAMKVPVPGFHVKVDLKKE